MSGANPQAKEISLNMNTIEKCVTDCGTDPESTLSGGGEGCTTEPVSLVENDREEHGRITRARRRVVKEVHTEFVYCGDEDFARVHVCGDWSRWRPIAMQLEEESVKSNIRKRTSNSHRTWSVITPVPIGYHEFCFVTDSHMTVSRRHPMTPDGNRNWRTVRGPRGGCDGSGRVEEGGVSSAWNESKLCRLLDRLADAMYTLACGRKADGDGRKERVDRGRDGEDKEREKDREPIMSSLQCKPKALNLTALIVRGIVVCGSVGVAVVGMAWLRGALTSVTST